MTPSEERASSAVRNLRSLFENKANDSSPSTRGRSPAGLGSEADNRPKSKVRASFFPVDSPNRLSGMASPPVADDKTSMAELNREPSTGRRTSFSEDKNSAVAEAIKGSVHAEGERRKADPLVAETIPEAAVETPLVEADKQLGKKKKKKGKGKGKAGEGASAVVGADASADADAGTVTVDQQAANPDKPVTGVEEEPAEMKPAQPTDEVAVSGGSALPPVAEDLRTADADAEAAAASTAPTKAANGKSTAKPPAIATNKSAPRPSTSSVKSPRTVSTASTASVPTPKMPTKKPSRSSLTAPTAASVARAAAADKVAATGVKQSSAPRPKARETTKPLDIPSRLTAPTAASRAKYEAPAAPEPKPTTARPKPTSSSRSTPRPSLGRPQSRSSEHESKKPGAPVSGSFLERMTRPTAASSNRTQKEAEVKSPLKPQKLPHRPKINGHPKSAVSTHATTAVEREGETTAIEEPSFVQEGESLEEATKPNHAVVEGGPEGKPAQEAASASKSAPEPTPVPVEEPVHAEEPVPAEEPIPVEEPVPAKVPVLASEPVSETASEQPLASEPTPVPEPVLNKSINAELSTGNEAPHAHTNGHKEDPPAFEDLESTPAAPAFDDSIR